MLWPFIDCYWCISIEKLPLFDFSFVNHKSPTALWGVWAFQVLEQMPTYSAIKTCRQNSHSTCSQQNIVPCWWLIESPVLQDAHSPLKSNRMPDVFQNRNGKKENPAPDRNTDFWTLFQTQRGKNHTLLSGTSPYSPYMRVKKPVRLIMAVQIRNTTVYTGGIHSLVQADFQSLST